MVGVCTRCGSKDHDHGPFDCPQYKLKLQQATEIKMKTYSDALRIGKKPLATVMNAAAPASASSSNVTVPVVAPAPAAPTVDTSLIIKGCLEIVERFLAKLFPKQAKVDMQPLHGALLSFVNDMSLDNAARKAAPSIPERLRNPMIVKTTVTQEKLKSKKVDEPAEEAQPKSKKIRTRSPIQEVLTAQSAVGKAYCSCGKEYVANGGGERI